MQFTSKIDQYKEENLTLDRLSVQDTSGKKDSTEKKKTIQFNGFLC